MSILARCENPGADMSVCQANCATIARQRGWLSSGWERFPADEGERAGRPFSLAIKPFVTAGLGFEPRNPCEG